MKKLMVFILFLLVFPSVTTAASIFTCNSTGAEKTSFYANETVYVVSSTNIVSNSTSVKFYIVQHSTWTVGANLTSAAVISRSIITNASGHVPLTSIWSPTLTLGTYDLIADVNVNQTYDSEDVLYNATGYGFSVSEIPAPSLIVSIGLNSSSDHSWYVDLNGSSNNMMLQLNLTASSYEAVKVTSLALIASGTGKDDTGISFVSLYYDTNGNGAFDQGESLLGFGQYLRDDGITNIDIPNGLTIPANSSLHVIFVYKMTGTSGSLEGSTYNFQLISMDGVGASSANSARISGLPINSVVKTVYISATPTTSTTSLPLTTTQPITTTTIQTTTTVEEGVSRDLLIGLSVALFAVIAILALFYFFFLKSPKPYHYTPS